MKEREGLWKVVDRVSESNGVILEETSIMVFETGAALRVWSTSANGNRSEAITYIPGIAVRKMQQEK